MKCHSRIRLPIYLQLLLVTSTFLTFTLLCCSPVDATTTTGIGCQHYNGSSNCPAEAPCCKSGYCSNAESFCALALGCEPENSFDANTCLPLPSCASFREDFNSPDSLIALTKFSGDPQEYAWTTDFLPNHANIENGNLVLRLQPGSIVNKFGNTPGFGATVSSTRWMLYGTVSARIKTGSPSGGIVSSFIYRNSMSGDEIDYEWVGKEPTNVQSNFYWHTPASMDPKDIDYSHAHHHEINKDLSQEYQTYTIEWLPDKLTWSINDQVIRTLLRSDVNGTKYPSTPSQIQFSVWDGGLADPETQQWAGGPTDWSDHRPKYEMYVDWVDIKCHDPVDPLTTPWPPKDQGFQGYVNPLSKNPNSPLAKEAIVLGANAPVFSTLANGGLHWGRYFKEGKNLFSNDATSTITRETAGLYRLVVALISIALLYVFAH